MVLRVGIEPTLTALSGQCLRVYKARPKANISNRSIVLAPSDGFEPPAFSFEAKTSSPLNYEGIVWST
jgi:hypothetical protein